MMQCHLFGACPSGVMSGFVERRTRPLTPAAGTQPGAEAASGPPNMPRWVAAVGTALFLPLTGLGIVLVPWWMTHWQEGAPYPLAVRAVGVILIAAGAIGVIWAHLRFATEGTGIPFPSEPSSRQVIVGGPYRYVRNPIYVAAVIAIAGQALLLSRPVLLIWGAAFLVLAASFVHWFEEPTLARRFGAQYDAYRKRVPGWWPRLPRRKR
jgi:protein-S-isoprenylcysteine O-methyltransferase Ste14